MIKFPEFASFSLPANPAFFSLVPLAAPMKEIKARRLTSSRISGIQVSYSGPRCLQQEFIFWHFFVRRINEICQQRKEDMLVLISQIMNFQSPKQFANAIHITQHGGNNDDRTT